MGKMGSITPSHAHVRLSVGGCAALLGQNLVLGKYCQNQRYDGRAAAAPARGRHNANPWRYWTQTVPTAQQLPQRRHSERGIPVFHGLLRLTPQKLWPGCENKSVITEGVVCLP